MDVDEKEQNKTIESLLGELSLEEKVLLLTGQDFWSTWPLEKIELRSMVLSDGPSGVRGPVWDERSPSLNLPSPTALASSWDRSVAYRYGEVAARAAIEKGVDVVLGPTINIHRSPLNGRHFEAFSEDPVLTADLAAAYVRGLQDSGVAATPKHYVANDSETDRFTVDVRVDDRALHEVYLATFEKPVVEGGAWTIMSAYNSVNGDTMTENRLLTDPLEAEWGFDGVVISDWTAVRTLESAHSAQDLVMPGPDGPWGETLVEAVQSGEIPEEKVDEKVRRLLRLASRVGALSSISGVERPLVSEETAEQDVHFAREASAEGTVLVRNDGILPLEPGLARIAVSGQNAASARTQGGGSATVIPTRTISPLEGIIASFPASEVTYNVGAISDFELFPIPLDQMSNPMTGRPGARVELVGEDAKTIYVEDRLTSTFTYFGGDAPVDDLKTFVFTTNFAPEEGGNLELGVEGAGVSRVYLDDVLLAEQVRSQEGLDLGAALLSPPEATVEVSVEPRVTYRLRVELDVALMEGSLQSSLGVTIGTRRASRPAEQLIAEAVAAAAEADVAVVVVGTSSVVESEGFDRDSLRLPGDQDALVRAVARVNPKTVVIVNAGAPVEMPWSEEVAGILIPYFGGQELGGAVAEILAGDREPGGRLPTTWPAQLSDCPSPQVTPDRGALAYEEGIHVGYKGWLRGGIAPACPFGFGLGYTDMTLDLLGTEGSFADDNLVVRLHAKNVGDRHGKAVPQVYVEMPDSSVDRPARWLVGFEATHLDAGQEEEILIPIPRHAVEYWDGKWVFEEGEYSIRAGWNVSDLSEPTPTH